MLIFSQSRESIIILIKPQTPFSHDSLPSLGTTHAVLHSSSDSGGCGSGSYDAASRAKKTVSFAEKVSYHSPAVSPHPSPKKTKSCGHLCDAALRGGYRAPVMGNPSAADMQYRNLITRDMVHAIQSEYDHHWWCLI